MFNNNERDKMEKTILVVEVVTYSSGLKLYTIKKHAENLEKATEYLVALKTLNTNADTAYELFNALGQFEVDRIEEVEVANAK